MIRAPGCEPLTLHVSGDEARFRIAIYRWEDGLLPVRLAARTAIAWECWRPSPSGWLAAFA